MSPSQLKSYTPVYTYPNEKTPIFEGERINNKIVRKVDEDYVRSSKAWWPCFFPTVIGLLSAGDEQEKNVMTISCITVMNRLPFMLGMPLYCEEDPEKGLKPRYTLSLIEKTGEFIINIPYINPKLIQAIEICGSYSGREGIDKFKEAKLTSVKGTYVNSPLIKDCVMNFECTLHSITRLGSHSWLTGKVAGMHVDEKLADGTAKIVWRSIPELELTGEGK